MFKSRRIATSGTGFQDRSSCKFDGSTTQLTISETDYSIDDQAHTFSFWFKRDSYDWDRIMANGTNTSWSFLLLGNEAASTRIVLDCDSSTGSDTNKGIITPDEGGELHKWYHIVVTTDGSNSGQIYEYGKALTTNNSSGGAMDRGFTVDRIGWGHDGWINDLAVYNTDVGAAGAIELFNHGQPYNHKEGRYSSNLINWWRMGDGNGDNLVSIKDQAGTNNATVVDAQLKIVGDVPW